MTAAVLEKPRDTVSGAASNDYYLIPATEKQIRYARQIATRSNSELPEAVQADRRRLSNWIDEHRIEPPVSQGFSNYPSSKQVAFAERIARLKRREVPRECFHDRVMMSRWIDSNR